MTAGSPSGARVPSATPLRQDGARGRGDLWAYASVAVATILWGTLHPIGKVILQEASPLQLVLARSLLTGVALVLALAVTGRLELIRTELRVRPVRIVGLGLLSFFASSGFSMSALQYLPASMNSLLSNTSPLMLAFGLALIERRAPGPRVALGLMLGFGGVVLLALRGASELGTIGLVAVLLSLGGSLTWAVYTGWSRHELQSGNPIAITAAGSLIGSTPMIAIGAFTGELRSFPALSGSTLALLLYAGLIGTAMTYSLWMHGLSRLPATNVAAFQYVIPLSAVTLAVLLLGEPLTLQLVAGGAAILLGVMLAQQRLQRRRR